MWLRFVEIWLTTRLLASPTFHKGVRRIHKLVHELRHGPSPEDMGGTKIEKPGLKDFFKHFREEIRNQLQNKIK